ncbi:hypothetical protein JCM11641_003080 [Rhodosporidiobolus odoratus]
MSGLIGLANKAYHKVRGTEPEDKDVDPRDALIYGGIGGSGSAAVGTLTGRSMGGGLLGQKAGESSMEATTAERGDAEPIQNAAL